MKMPRQARKKSEIGIYHVMLRGINKQQIFEYEEDQERFIETLKRYKKEIDFKVYAYCLMGNHIHLMLKEGNESISETLKRIAGSYVYWYNWKYGRSGHLFQDRFKSEPINDDEYLLTVLRYIHQNPIKAKICEKVEEYKFSSFNEYLKESNLIDTDLIYSIISKEELVEFHKEENTDNCLDFEESSRLPDGEAKQIIEEITLCKSVADFQALDKMHRNMYIKALHDKRLSIRQICRLTGISKKIVEINIF